MLKYFVFPLLFICCVNISFSQEQFRLSNWNLYSSLHNVTAAVEDDAGRIWAGTEGGIFVYDAQNDTAKIFNLLNGLTSNEVTALYFDEISKYTIVGFSDGILEIIDKDYNIEHITSIRDAQFSKPRINKIISQAGNIYIAGGFGMAVFDINKMIFTTTISKISNWTKNESIYDIRFFDNKIWAASEVGAAWCPLDMLLEVPRNWTTAEFSGKAGIEPVISFASRKDSLFAVTDKNVYKFHLDTFELNFSSDAKIFHVQSFGDEIYLLRLVDIITTSNDTFYNGLSNGLLFDKNGKSIVLTPSGLNFVKYNTVLKNFTPNSPKTNLFSRIVLDNSGDLWSVSAHLELRTFEGGITHFSQNVWENYNAQSNPLLKKDAFFEIALFDNTIYATNYGGGLAKIDIVQDSLAFSFFDQNNSLFEGQNSDGFLVIGGVDRDSKASMWFSNWGNISSGPFLISMDNQGKQTAYSNCYYPNERRVLRLLVDDFGTKWIGSFPGEGLGIYYFNENGTPEDKSDDVCGMISTSTHSNLPDNSPTVMRKDASGNIWLGFRQGVSFIRNPQSALTKSAISVFQLNFMNGLKVNDIMIDPLGYVWVATATGVWVISKNFELVKQINSQNSPLKEDNILSLAGNFETGIIYFGTEQGLYTVQSMAILPLESYNVHCYPQPYDLRKAGEMIIDGLTADTEISIVTINGELVRSIKVEGKQAVWDGRDDNKKLVSSGIYLVVTNSTSSNSGSVQKIAVISN